MIRGENHIVRVMLYEVDGVTELVLPNLYRIEASIRQRSTTIATYIYGTDAELRDGIATGQLELEVKKAVSQQFESGVVYMDITIDKTDPDFDVDLRHRDIAQIELFNVD